MKYGIKKIRPSKTVQPHPELWQVYRSIALRRGDPACSVALDEAIRLYIEKYKKEE